MIGKGLRIRERCSHLQSGNAPAGPTNEAEMSEDTEAAPTWIRWRFVRLISDRVIHVMVQHVGDSVIAQDDEPAVNPGRVRFPGISSRAYEHPADRTALVALRKLHGLDTVLKKFQGMFSERVIRMENLATAVRTNDRQFSGTRVMHSSFGIAHSATKSTSRRLTTSSRDALELTGERLTRGERCNGPSQGSHRAARQPGAMQQRRVNLRRRREAGSFPGAGVDVPEPAQG
jgi:hypothetical protein